MTISSPGVSLALCAAAGAVIAVHASNPAAIAKSGIRAPPRRTAAKAVELPEQMLLISIAPFSRQTRTSPPRAADPRCSEPVAGSSELLQCGNVMLRSHNCKEKLGYAVWRGNRRQNDRLTHRLSASAARSRPDVRRGEKAIFERS
ncbi:hypothetical protein Q4F19_15530 [Sphingomonas sp. BIUV-7]|uniref:Secreted protein n=1 Tax=Sphingomonas natans TaxID=3063330 RepID=A0ABT8YBT5_9SPHN|nr:hypothetical protein [Sphingomonas sp. BIUV-7]MDO6415802.1 hypothetical protein [Sphingomonas sp. BIUV-7]